jgi:hypothetical protein
VCRRGDGFVRVEDPLDRLLIARRVDLDDVDDIEDEWVQRRAQVTWRRNLHRRGHEPKARHPPIARSVISPRTGHAPRGPCGENDLAFHDTAQRMHRVGHVRGACVETVDEIDAPPAALAHAHDEATPHLHHVGEQRVLLGLLVHHVDRQRVAGACLDLFEQLAPPSRLAVLGPFQIVNVLRTARPIALAQDDRDAEHAQRMPLRRDRQRNVGEEPLPLAGHLTQARTLRFTTEAELRRVVRDDHGWRCPSACDGRFDVRLQQLVEGNPSVA